MIHSRRIMASFLIVLVLCGPVPDATACGPSSIEPIFVFRESPDLPFDAFINGNLGIVQPTFGRKTLVIAYRYLNGGSFSQDEQKELIYALRGAAPETESNGALKTWIAARKEFVDEDEKLPEIYVERQFGGYDFFPNCTKNAFEVATATLKDRAASYGGASPEVRQWLAGQDTVFKNCVSGSNLPEEIGPERPAWLRKDRNYQIAAALFYSLNFDQARARFENIALDNESPWQQTADYLIARSLVRQASFSQEESKQRQFYEQAETHLQGLLSKGGKFYGASQRMLGLVRYRIHPEERLTELAHNLAWQNANDNLRQDLIDYVWLLDRFENQILKDEAERKKGSPAEPSESRNWLNEAYKKRFEAIQGGKLIEVRIYLKKVDGKPDYRESGVAIDFKHDISEFEILQAFETELGRRVTTEEEKDIKAAHKSALSDRDWLMGPNRKWPIREHEGGYHSDKLDLSLMPEFVKVDDLSNWIFTVQTADPGAYNHAYERWRETGSEAWLTAALIKADRVSRGLERLMAAARKVSRDSPAFAGAVYHLVRLKIAGGKKAEAREMLDEIIGSGLDQFPISARNLFREQRLQLAEDLNVFLRSGLRMPIVFYNEGRLASLSRLLEVSKSYWNPDYQPLSREEYESRLEEEYRRLLPWNDQLVFDRTTTEVLNTFFPLPALVDSARSPAVPDYLRQRILLAIWTRAILLKKQNVADQVAPELLKVAPEMASVLASYQKARTVTDKQRAALFVLLKFQHLSPFIDDGLPLALDQGDPGYFYQSSWWCPPSDTEYNDDGEEVPKQLRAPEFLTPHQLTEAQRDRAALVAMGDAKSYLGRRVLEWARTTPNDPRLPEALFIAARANAQYKYGCNGWEYDRETKETAEGLLRTRYPESPWTAKLSEPLIR